MPVTFPTPPETSDEADITKSAYEAALAANEYEGTVFKKYLWPSYQVVSIPATLEADFEAADDEKKQVMIVLAQTVLASVPNDFNTAYEAEYDKIYP